MKIKIINGLIFTTQAHNRGENIRHGSRWSFWSKVIKKLTVFFFLSHRHMALTITAEKYMLVTPYMMMKILASDRLLKQ